MWVLTTRILIGSAAVLSLFVFAEPAILTLVCAPGKRLTSINLTATETSFNWASPPHDPYMFTYVTVPTWRVVLWIVAASGLTLITTKVVVRWYSNRT